MCRRLEVPLSRLSEPISTRGVLYSDGPHTFFSAKASYAHRYPQLIVNLFAGWAFTALESCGSLLLVSPRRGVACKGEALFFAAPGPLAASRGLFLRRDADAQKNCNKR